MPRKKLKKYLRYGASPRAAQTILMAGPHQGNTRRAVPCSQGGYQRGHGSGFTPPLNPEFSKVRRKGMTTDKIIEDILKEAE